MHPALTFSSKKILCGDKGVEATLPDLKGEWNFQNKTLFHLDETDEIYQGYGKRTSAYPYRQYNAYSRNISEKAVRIIILENDYLKAVFIPDFGGRLWELWDKSTGENLLYTNDVIRPSNLAICNAWFSGGVEWNIGMIGHTPFTMEPMFVSTLEDEHGNPILRMYEYERIRNVTYQMDFWLEENCPYLKCRMRITNQTNDVVPMYWWSNIAVPEYPGGRVIVPAEEAYTSSNADVSKTSVPYVDGNDISLYNQIPSQVDYFFNIPEDVYHYEANINANGYGLVQYSTKRLRGRKIFSWGANRGSSRWQEWLTNDAGRYVEIQGGLGKTQYGCIPMAPCTAWEWMEYYGPLHIDNFADHADFESAKAFMQKEAARVIGPDSIYSNGGIEAELKMRKPLALTKGKLVSTGSGYAITENLIRQQLQMTALPEHLDFSSDDTRQTEWNQLLTTGTFPSPDAESTPLDYCGNEYIYKKLKEYTSQNPDNWYAWFQKSCYEYYIQNYSQAAASIDQSLQCCESSVGLYIKALVSVQDKDSETARQILHKACLLRKSDLSFLKDAFRLALECDSSDLIIEIYESLDESLKKDGRLRFNYITALENTGNEKKAFELLTENDGLELADLRECDGGVGTLWQKLHNNLYPDCAEKTPYVFHFNAFDASDK